ncbi:MAG: beta-galactosidase [Rhodoluna sp.]
MTAFKQDRILYGAAYYNEYHQTERTAEDFRLMAEAGVNVIRVGESVWAKWQPTETSFNLDWLEPVLDAASDNGIGVIIGTPTYAVPRWIFQNHPEVVAERATGWKVPFGHRQNVDYSNQKFRELCEQIIVKIVGRYRNHPAVIGWQVDNEPGAELLHNAGVFQAFKQKLRTKYQTVDALNAAWGLTYWSHALNDFDDLWLPDGNTNPSYFLAWRQHQAEITNNFLDWQRGLVRGLIAKEQFITTCVALDRPGMDNQTIGETLDVTSVNIYYATQEGLNHPRVEPSPGELTPAPMWVPLSGASALNLICDNAWGIRQENFLITETNGSAIQQGPATSAFPHWPGQFKQAALAMVSRGAQMVEYWHWHTLPFGVENHWGGILPHSLKPGRTYRSFQETAKSLEAISELGELKPAAEVAIVISTASKWLFEFQGPIRQENGMADPLAYQKTLQSMYEIAYNAGLGVRLIGDNQITDSASEFAKQHPIMILHSLYVCSDETLEFARDYAAAGGTLLVGPRTGYAKPDAVIRTETAPAILGSTAGVSYNEYSMLAKAQPVVAKQGDRVGSVWAWFDELEATADTIELRVDHPFFGEFAAMTTRKHGSGSISFLASYPDQQLSTWLGKHFANAAGEIIAPSSNSESVVVNRASTKDGHQVSFVFNWSWNSASVALPTNYQDVESGERLSAGQSTELGAWGVRVLVEEN